MACLTNSVFLMPQSDEYSTTTHARKADHDLFARRAPGIAEKDGTQPDTCPALINMRTGAGVQTACELNGFGVQRIPNSVEPEPWS